MKIKNWRCPGKLDFLVRFALWLFFTFGNFGCALGYFVRTALYLDPVEAIQCVFHLAVALWLLLWCKPNMVIAQRKLTEI